MAGHSSFDICLEMGGDQDLVTGFKGLDRRALNRFPGVTGGPRIDFAERSGKRYGGLVSRYG